MFRNKMLGGFAFLVSLGLMTASTQGAWWQFWKKEAQAVEKTQVKKNPEVTEAKSEPAKVKTTEQKGIRTIKGIYVPKEILYLTWGEGNYQVGVDTEQGLIGPQEIRVDKKNRNILMLDTINGRILRYTDGGKFLDSMKISKGAESLCIYNDSIYVSTGGALVRGGQTILKYNLKGNLLKKWEVPPEMKNPGNYLTIDKKGNLLAKSSYEGYNVVSLDDNRGICKIEKEVLKGDTYYEIKRERLNKKDYMEVINKGDLRIKIETSKPKYFNIVDIVGEDREQNVYVYLIIYCWDEKVEKETKNYEIRKYNQKGTLLNTINLLPPCEHSFMSGRNVDIDNEGNIYYLQTLETGVKVIKYELQ